MSDFGFRWAGMTPAETWQQQMQGYRPNGSIPATPKDYSQFYEDELNGLQQQRDREAELAQLETELAQVEAQIAEFDRMNPGIASGDIDIAATMMEAGNYSPYQQAVNAEIGRRQMGESAKAGAMSGVWNGIDNARNAIAGYAKMSDDQRAVALDLARTELDKAKRAANGSELPREYYDVLAKIDNPDTGDGMNNETYWRNSFTAKVSKNNLHDTDIVELKEYANKNPNKELTAKLYAIVREFEKRTEEKKSAGKKERAEADCGSSDKDEPEVALASQVAGSYTGNEIIVVSGEESSNGTATYTFTKASDTSLDLVIPASGESGMMMIPQLPVKDIPLTKSGNTITGKLLSYTGSVTNSSGSEKAYTISNLVVIFNDRAVAVTFSLKYGNMPFEMTTNFTGTR